MGSLNPDARTARSHPRPRRPLFPTAHQRRLAVAVLLLAIGVRFWGLGTESFWLDEVFSALVIQGPFGGILNRIPNDKPPLDYCLQALAHPLGPPEVSHRLPAVLASLATVCGVFFWARIGFGRRVAIVASLLACFNLPILYFAQEARPYSLMMALTAWQQGVFLLWWLRTSVPRADESPSWPLFLALLFLTLACLFTMYSALIVIAAEIAVLGLAPWITQRRSASLAPSPGCPDQDAERWVSRPFAPLVRFLVLVGLVLIPVWAILWRRAALYPSALYFWRYDRIGILDAVFLWNSPWISGVPPAAAICLCAFSLWLAALGLRLGWSLRRVGVAQLLAGSILPLVLLPLLYAEIDRPYQGRYATFCVPGFCVLYGLGMVELGRMWRVGWRSAPAGLRRSARGFPLALAAGSGIVSVAILLAGRPAREDWRAAAQFIADRAQPRDLVVVPGDAARCPVAYYLDRLSPVPLEIQTQNAYAAGSGHRRTWMVTQRFGEERRLTSYTGVGVELQGDPPDLETVSRLVRDLGRSPVVRLADCPPDLLGDGWSHREVWSPDLAIRWAVSQHARLYLPLPEPGAGRLILTLFPHSYEGAPVQTIAPTLGGLRLATQEAPPWILTKLEWSVPVSATRAGLNCLELEFGHIRSPSELKKNYGDFRTLAAAVQSVQWVYDAPAPTR